MGISDLRFQIADCARPPSFARPPSASPQANAGRPRMAGRQFGLRIWMVSI